MHYFIIGFQFALGVMTAKFVIGFLEGLADHYSSKIEWHHKTERNLENNNSEDDIVVKGFYDN